MVPNKNRFIRLFFISVSLLVYFYFFVPKLKNQPVVAPAIPAAQTTGSLPLADGISPVMTTPFSVAMEGKQKYITVENELLKVVLSTKGGMIKEVILKKYKDQHGQALVLLDENSSNMGLSFPYQGLLIDTKPLYFETEAKASYTINQSQVVTIVFRLVLAPSQYLEQSFTFTGNSYQINYDWHTVGILHPGAHPSFSWHMDMKSLEADHKGDASRSTVHYCLLDESFNKLKESSTDIEQKKIEVPVKWVTIKQRFFSSAIIADDSFATGDVRMEPVQLPNATKFVDLSFALSTEKHNGKAKSNGKFIFFFGPNDYKVLKKVTKGFEENLPLGWTVVKWVNKGMIIPLFSFLEKHFSNYGLIIFLLVVMIKLLLLPLSYKSFISMAKMQILKPELDKIKEKYKNDLPKAHLEQAAFCRELGINSLSGCMPTLLQMPILLAMFNFFPHAIALRQASFLWAHDLSTYDSIMTLPCTIPIYGNHVSLFTLLMLLSTILYTQFGNQSSPKEGPMKLLAYVMPFVFMFMLNTFPAGLSFYYCISNVMTFLQQKLISYWVNTDRIKEKLITRQNNGKQGPKLSFQEKVTAVIEANNKKKK